MADDLTLFTVEMSLNATYFRPKMPCTPQTVIDVFAYSRDEALELARMVLRHPDQYDVDGVTEN